MTGNPHQSTVTHVTGRRWGGVRLLVCAAASALTIGCAALSRAALGPNNAPSTPGATPPEAAEANGLVPGRVTEVVSGPAMPWGLTFLPDGSALVSGRFSGEISHVPAGGAQWVVSDNGAAAGGAEPHPVPSQASPAQTDTPVQFVPYGDYDVLVEVLKPRPQLVVVGAEPVAVGLTALAHMLGYRSTVVDARAELLTPERFPAADDLRLGIPDEVFGFAACGAATAVVLTAYNYAYEVPVLREVLCSKAGYIGLVLVAGRRRGQAVMAFLEQTGIDPIFAEIVAHREGKLGLPLTLLEAARSGLSSAFAGA